MIPLNHWNDQYDTVWHATQSDPYFGVGFRDWRFQLYERDHSYYPPSSCSYGWWSFEVDGNWCDPEIPAYFKSKGSWNGTGFNDGPIFVDHDPPFFGDNIEDPYGGIDVLLGSELDQSSDPYIANLYGDLSERGDLYKSNGAPVISQQDFWTYYWNNVGSDVDADEPVVVVRAQDEPSDQGRYIDKFLAGDYTYLGQNYADDEMAEHLFYADVSPYAPDELTEEYWPVLVGEQIVPMRLPTDGDEKGEFSVWILPVDCALLDGDISSFRLRTTDDINNWRRSPEFVTAVPELQIDCPTVPIPAGEDVELTAHITGSTFCASLETSIKWSVQVYEGGEWVDYGPHEDENHQYDDSGYKSDIPEGVENWTGTTFFIADLEDCTMRVRARLQVCGETFDDTCDLEDDLVIVIETESPPYWIDGPSIPAYPGGAGNWHTDSLQTVQVGDHWGSCGCENVQRTMEPEPLFQGGDCGQPNSEGLRPGQVQIKICVQPQQCDPAADQIAVDILGTDGWFDYNLAIYDGPNAHCTEPLVWDLQDEDHYEDCGIHTIFVTALKNGHVVKSSRVTVELSRVTKQDFWDVAYIYLDTGTRYGADMGWQCCPGVRGLGEDYPFIDCSGFVTQVLRRLARCDGADPKECYHLGEYDPPHEDPLEHYYATRWRGEERAKIVTRQEMRDSPDGVLRLGDILVWMDDYHVAIFEGWQNKDNLIAYTLESWDEEEIYPPVGHGPGVRTRNLVKENVEGRRWWMEEEQGANVIIFRSCQ